MSSKCSPVVGSPFQRPHPVSAHLFEQAQPDPAAGVLTPPADDPAVPPGCGAAVAVAVEDLAAVFAEVPLPVEPAHRGDIQARQQRAPGVDVRLGLDVVG